MSSKYLCLRDCFVGDRYFAKDTVWDLPDNLEKSPKNFQLVGDNTVKEPEPTPAPLSEVTGALEPVRNGVVMTPEPEVYVAEHPYKSRRKKR